MSILVSQSHHFQLHYSVHEVSDFLNGQNAQLPDIAALDCALKVKQYKNIQFSIHSSGSLRQEIQMSIH